MKCETTGAKMATVRALLSSPFLLRRQPIGSEALESKVVSLCPLRRFPCTEIFVAAVSRSHGCRATTASLERKATKRETIIPDPDYRIPVVLLGTAGGFLYQQNLLPAATFGLLGLLLLFQTTRVRFVFDEEALVPILRITSNRFFKNNAKKLRFNALFGVGQLKRYELVSNLKNPVKMFSSVAGIVGSGILSPLYSAFVNWELWWPNFPVLVYFKETQTKPEGQVHFFPVIFNGKQLYDVMLERAGPSKNSSRKLH